MVLPIKIISVCFQIVSHFLMGDDTFFCFHFCAIKCVLYLLLPCLYVLTWPSICVSSGHGLWAVCYRTFLDSLSAEPGRWTQRGRSLMEDSQRLFGNGGGAQTSSQPASGRCGTINSPHLPASAMYSWAVYVVFFFEPLR